MSNVVFIEFLDKTHFPQGVWRNEPDFCCWSYQDLPCLAIRDMKLGVWRGLVGIDAKHPLFGKKIDDILKIKSGMDIFLDIYGGLASAGKLPSKYREYGSELWWFGLETSNGGDLMPLLKLDENDPETKKVIGKQTYKSFAFIRKETTKLAKMLKRIA
jgi:hypothetical protein